MFNSTNFGQVIGGKERIKLHLKYKCVCVCVCVCVCDEAVSLQPVNTDVEIRFQIFNLKVMIKLIMKNN
jgi:hypothetical protein